MTWSDWAHLMPEGLNTVGFGGAAVSGFFLGRFLAVSVVFVGGARVVFSLSVSEESEDDEDEAESEELDEELPDEELEELEELLESLRARAATGARTWPFPFTSGG